MPPPPDHVYFPPLGGLLEGEAVLLSWTLISSALRDAQRTRRASTAVTEFLTDPFVLGLIAAPSSVFAPATAETASAFETRTAAINVTPAPDDKYSICTIQADTSWLSKAVGINEVAALRIVVVELQSRAQAFLAAPLTSQDATNIRKAASGSTLTIAEGTFDADELWSDFNTEKSRRQRLLTTYLSECRCFAFAVDIISIMALNGTAPFSADNEIARTSLSAPSTYISHLRRCITRADLGVPNTITNAGVDLAENLAAAWTSTALTEAVHWMSVIFVVLQSLGPTFASPALTAEWFGCVGEYGFFDAITTSDATVAQLAMPLKTLACVISLRLLNLNRAIGYLDRDLELDGDEEAYINDPDALEAIHNAIVAAADAGFTTASPVFLAWSLILYRMDVSYQERSERRDLAQNQRAQDNLQLASSPFNIQQSLQPRGRRNSAGSIVSIEPARYDAFLSERVLTIGPDVEPLIPWLANTATGQCRVYDVVAAMATSANSGSEAALRPGLGPAMHQAFLHLLKASFPIVGYQADPFSAVLAILSGGREPWDHLTSLTVRDDDMTAAFFLQDAHLMGSYVGNALGRFPYEFAPFVSISRLLAACTSQPGGISDVIMETLLQTPTITFTLPMGFNGYTMVDDADHPTATMRTQEDIPLFPPAPSRRRLVFAGERQVAAIPAGSYGRFMIDGSGIVNIDYEHSTLALLGKQLDVNLSDDMYEPILGLLEPTEVAETINLLTALIRSEVRKAYNASIAVPGDAARSSQVVSEAGLAVLQEISRDLEETRDIIAVITGTLDTLIQDGPAETDETRMEVLVACLDFLAAILPLCPGRVWSYMARCQLLNTDSSAGRLCILTGTSEIMGERFNFLSASVRMLAGLTENALISSVQRRIASRPSRRSNHQQMEEGSIWLGASEKTVEQVCLSIAQTVIDVYENSSTWKFASDVHKSRLIADAVGILRNITVHASSLEAPAGMFSYVSCFEPAADFVIKSFLSSSSSSLRFQPLLETLMAAQGPRQLTLYSRQQRLLDDRVVAVLGLATALLRVAGNVEEFAGKAPALEAQIFQVSSLPARLCSSEATRQPSLDLLTSLVTTAAARASEPPSLLGYLGPHISRSFLGVLLMMDKPFQRPAEAARVWKFFSTILRNRQQWMANCLLTGKTPREALQTDNGRVTKLSSNSALVKAKDALQSIATLPQTEAIAVLDFFTAAQNYWPWTIFAIRSESQYLTSMRTYVRGLESPLTTARNNPLSACNEARIAAYIAESFAMQLYHMRQMGTEKEFAREVVQDLDYYIRHGVTVSGYNASLHANFQRNFASRYQGCTLDQLKRSMIQPRDLGPQFYYALDMADRIFSFDRAWSGIRNNSGGFKYEMQMANLNLSLVDAQIALFHAFEVLLLELSVCLLPNNRQLNVMMLQVAKQCMASNRDIMGPQLAFAKIAQARANLALLLLQRLVEHSLLPRDVGSILQAIWFGITTVENPWSPEQRPYYSTLLRMLYIVLRGHPRERSGASEDTAAAAAATAQPAAPAAGGVGEAGAADAMVVSTTQTVLNVLDQVVARGFRTLISMVHEEGAESRPEDLALLTAVLQACLSTPGMASCQTQVLNIMASHNVMHVATSLFSWSDRLLVDDRDPVYGELSLLFLLELSALPAVAEQLACDGFLSHLSTARLAGYMQRAGVSPFADAAALQRCYSIWTKAVLPLLVNLLLALGTSIAPEIAYVLNQFPNLLKASVQRIEAPGLSRTSAATLSRGSPAKTSSGPYLTLLVVNEVHSLALLTRVLEALRVNHERSIPPVKWEGALVLESIDFWLSRPRLLRERLVPLGPREAEWRTSSPLVQRSPGGLAENRLEEKAFQLLGASRTILSDEDAE